MTSRPNIQPSNRTEEARRLLMDAIRQLPLASHFSRATLKAAEALAPRSKDWQKPLAWFQPDGSQAQALQCAVIDSDGTLQCVTVYLFTLFGQGMLESQCSCNQPQCLHAAAMLIRLQQLLDWPRAMTPLQRWQQNIGTLHELPPPQIEPSVGRESWQLVCVLQPDNDRSPAKLAVQLMLTHGSDSQRWLSAEQPRAQPHLSRQAMLWQSQLAMTQKKRRPNEPSYLLHGHGGANLLSEFLQAGICRHTHTLQDIRAGEPRQPHWQWTHDTQARARIALRWPDSPEVQLIELDGLHYLDLAAGEFGTLDLSRTTWEIVQHMPAVPPAEAIALAEAWPPHPLLASVPPPPTPPPARPVNAALRPVAVIGASRHEQRGDYAFYVHIYADYGGHRLPLADEAYQQEVIRQSGRGYVLIQRNVAQETLARRALEKADIVDIASLLPDARRKLTPAPDAHAFVHREHCLGAAETFAALETVLQSLTDAGYVIEYDPELPFTVLPRETRLKAVLDQGKRPGWTQFELAATIDGEQLDVLPIVLGGLSRRAFSLAPTPGEPTDAHWLAPVGNQRWLPLPLKQLREWIGPLVECLDRPLRSDQRHIDVSRSQAMALSGCLQHQGIAVEGSQAASIAETLAALRAAAQMAPTITLPDAFHGTLRGYQREGLQWLQALRQGQLGGVLADDMGLGKTVQIIAHLLLEQEAGRLEHPALIVAPTSLVFNWLDEVARFAPVLRCVNFTGPSRAALRNQLKDAHVIVTSYALLVNDLSVWENIDYAMLVLDEAQWIKNPLTQTARAVRLLRAKHRLAVTGTPLENHLGELWAHFDAVLPGYLGDYRSFNRSFRQPIEQQEDDARKAILRQRIAPFLLRRSKAAVAPELPPKTETVLRVAMGESQRRLYESLRLAQNERVREALSSYNNEQSRIVVLSALLRLRQVCCDPRLLDNLDDPPESAKLEALLELIQSLREEGRQVLVFSQFTSMLTLITAALDKAELGHAVLTGDTADRAKPVRDFQSGASPILLASLKAGGVGLNLTAADAVIHYDPWWNPAVEMQAVDRAHRLGREHPVFVYKLLCDDTIEEKIEAMKDQKSDLAGAMLGDAASPLSRLSGNELRQLFDLPSL
ncbi:DEAD/DEAH box helicase [Dyella jejuensis]|uniref:DEAD/DEAH box helicase n=1 Tax=Dyella jejuensis TaxID=1432009 RepID=A0ABW8JJY6_9GAMM